MITGDILQNNHEVALANAVGRERWVQNDAQLDQMFSAVGLRPNGPVPDPQQRAADELREKQRWENSRAAAFSQHLIAVFAATNKARRDLIVAVGVPLITAALGWLVYWIYRGFRPGPKSRLDDAIAELDAGEGTEHSLIEP